MASLMNMKCQCLFNASHHNAGNCSNKATYITRYFGPNLHYLGTKSRTLFLCDDCIIPKFERVKNLRTGEAL